MIWLSAALAAPALTGGGGTADTLADGGGKIALGVFRPWTIKVSDRTDLKTTGVIGTIMSPRVDIKTQVLRRDDHRVAIIGGLNVPTFAMRLGRGWLYTESDRLPLSVIGKLGVAVTIDMSDTFKLTGYADLRFGVPFGANDITPRDFYFVDWALAPLVDGPVTSTWRVQADVDVSPKVHLTTAFSMQLTTDAPEFVGRVFGLWGFADHLALGAGVFTHHDHRPDGYRHYWIPGADFQIRL